MLYAACDGQQLQGLAPSQTEILFCPVVSYTRNPLW